MAFFPCKNDAQHHLPAHTASCRRHPPRAVNDWPVGGES